MGWKTISPAELLRNKDMDDFEIRRQCLLEGMAKLVGEEVVSLNRINSTEGVRRFLEQLDEFEAESRKSNIVVW